jgi:hypothetical protein
MIITWFALRRFLFNQVSGNVTVGDIITGRTIHCKSLDELLVKEEDIREKIIRYCKNLGACTPLRLAPNFFTIQAPCCHSVDGSSR